MAVSRISSLISLIPFFWLPSVAADGPWLCFSLGIIWVNCFEGKINSSHFVYADNFNRDNVSDAYHIINAIYAKRSKFGNMHQSFDSRSDFHHRPEFKDS